VAIGYFGNQALAFFRPMLIEEFGKWWPAVIALVVLLAFAIVAVISRALGRRATKQD